MRRVAASEGESLLVASSSSSSSSSSTPAPAASSESKEKGAETAAAAAAEKAQEEEASFSSYSSYSVPQGHCWVLADNEALPLPAARDSRAFGPLSYAAIIGRVVYAAASVTDHRPILRGGSGSAFAASSSSSSGGAFATSGSFASDSFAPASSASRGAFDEDVLEAELDIRELAPPAPVS